MKKRKNGNADIKYVNASGIARISLIVYLFDKLSDAIYNALISGFFGYIFTAYSSELKSYNGGYFVSYFNGERKTRSFFRSVRKLLSQNFESSAILRAIRRSVCGLAFVPLKTYGTFFISFGIYILLVYLVKLILPITGTADVDYIYVGVIMCVAAIPIYRSPLNLARAVQKGKITSFVFVDGFGYNEEDFTDKSFKNHSGTWLAVILGLSAGIFTFVIHPLEIFGIITVFAITSLIFTVPEIGVLLCIFFIPFFSFLPNPTVALTTFAAITTFAYIIKIIRGKRIFKLELIDFSVLLFLCIMLLSGAITFGGKASYYSALISCLLMFGYFLVVNLIRTEKWLNRCINALVISGIIVAVLGVLQYVLGMAQTNWLDTSYFPDINGRSTSLFENPNYLSAYLALILPFAVFKAITTKNSKKRALMFIACFMVICCAVFTWSRGAWLAIIITILIFFLIYSRKTMRFLYIAGITTPFLPFVLPKNIVNRFMSIGDISDSSTLYRVYTWKGCLKMSEEYFWGGIGYGTEAFTRFYPSYAYAGIETAAHSHSLYLQILIGMGIGGLVCFAFIMFLYVQKSFEYLKSPLSKNSLLVASAALCATAALLIMGMFDYVWYNYRIFFMFWIVMALGVACIRIGKSELDQAPITEDFSDRFASVDVEI